MGLSLTPLSLLFVNRAKNIVLFHFLQKSYMGNSYNKFIKEIKFCLKLVISQEFSQASKDVESSCNNKIEYNHLFYQMINLHLYLHQFPWRCSYIQLHSSWVDTFFLSFAINFLPSILLHFHQVILTFHYSLFSNWLNPLMFSPLS